MAIWIRAPFALFAALSISSFACSSTPTEGTPTPASDAGVADAPTEAGCPKGTRADGARCTANTLGEFTRSSVELSLPRDHHTTHVFTVGGVPYLYVLGGTVGWKEIYSDVWRAKIRPDGEIDAFEEAGTLPEKVAGHIVVRVGDTLVLAGGTNGASVTSATYATKLGPDGRLGDWTKGPALPVGVMHGHAVAHGGYAYFVGGRGAKTGKSVANVARVRVSQDGILGPMEPLADLAADRSHGQAFVHGDYMYVFGGLRGDPAGEHEALDDVLRAKLGGPSLTWEVAGKLPAARSITAAEVVGDDVFVLGGLEGKTSFRADAWHGVFDAGGKLTFAPVQARLPFSRGHVHQTPYHDGRIYSVGGKNAADRSFGTVDIARCD